MFTVIYTALIPNPHILRPLEWHLVGMFPSFFITTVSNFFCLKPSDDEHLASNASASASPWRPPLQWSWEIEHADRKKERKADAALHGATPFEVDRRVLKDIVREKMGVDVGLITFLSAGEYLSDT